MGLSMRGWDVGLRVPSKGLMLLEFTVGMSFGVRGE